MAFVASVEHDLIASRADRVDGLPSGDAGRWCDRRVGDGEGKGTSQSARRCGIERRGPGCAHIERGDDGRRERSAEAQRARPQIRELCSCRADATVVSVDEREVAVSGLAPKECADRRRDVGCEAVLQHLHLEKRVGHILGEPEARRVALLEAAVKHLLRHQRVAQGVALLRKYPRRYEEEHRWE